MIGSFFGRKVGSFFVFKVKVNGSFFFDRAVGCPLVGGVVVFESTTSIRSDEAKQR